MAEKKIVTLGIRMDETMLMDVKGLAEVDGVTESELARIAISTYIEDRRSLYLRLDSIFGNGSALSKASHAQRGATIDAPQEPAAPAVR